MYQGVAFIPMPVPCLKVPSGFGPTLWKALGSAGVRTAEALKCLHSVPTPVEITAAKHHWAQQQVPCKNPTCVSANADWVKMSRKRSAWQLPPF